MPNTHAITEYQGHTLSSLFQRRCELTPDAPAYKAYDRATENWISYSWQQAAEEVGRWQAALQNEDLQAGDHVAIALRNCPEWIFFEQAAIGLGLIVVPLYPDDRAENCAYIVEHAEAKLLLVQDYQHWKRLAQPVRLCPSLKRVVLLGDKPGKEPFTVASRDWLPEKGSEPRTYRGNPGGLATIVYTSGTTGRPKGVMLSHSNILSNALACSRCAEFFATDRFLSFLPLAHMLERTGGYYLPMLLGAEVVFARSVIQLSADLEEQKPTVLITVPRIFERVKSRLDEQLAKAPPFRRRLFDTAVRLGWRRFEYRQGRAKWHPALLAAPLLQRLVGRRLLDKLGGRLRYAVSGGAPLAETHARTFIGLGLTIIQGYGLTEASPVISVNHPEDNEPSSIGPALENIEVKLGDHDELLTRGPHVSLGYWRNEEATADLIDSDGWLHTGDKATIGPRGHVTITGRIKDIIVLSNGEKVPPADMEMAISDDPLLEQVMVIGEGKAWLAALAVLNLELWQKLAGELGLDADDPQSLGHKKLEKRLLARMGDHLKDFPSYAKIRRVHATLEPWTTENGLLTPTMKMKRGPILERYAQEVSALFQ